MNGPEHYAEAERLLSATARIPGATEANVARAQVHATLALVDAIRADRWTGPQESNGGHTTYVLPKDGAE